MGNQSSSSEMRSIGMPSSQLKLKVGDKNDPIPCPIAVSKAQLQAITSDPDFKEFVLQNLHSNSFIRSIILNSSDESIVLEGISYFQAINRDVRAEYNNEVKKFQDYIMADLQSSLLTTTRICERDLEYHKSPRSSPYHRSFQCRLAAIRELEPLILLERKKTQEKSTAQPLTSKSLNSQEFPHLSFIYPLMTSGISLVQMLPHLLLSSSDHHVQLLLQSFSLLRRQYQNIPDLHLYSCWSPPPLPPMKRLQIERHNISSNTGDPYKVLNDLPHQYWTCPTKGGVLCINFDTPTRVSSVSVSWAPQSTGISSTGCGAPKKLHIFIRKSHRGSPLKYLQCIDVDEERKRTRSWHHDYPLVGDLQDVFSIFLKPEDVSQYNQATSDHIKIYHVGLYSEEIEATWIDVMTEVHKFQTTLFELTSVPLSRVDLLCTLFTLPRITGSLLVLLNLISFFKTRNTFHDLDCNFDDYYEVWVEMHRLSSAIRNVHLHLHDEVINGIHSQELTKSLTKSFVFDESAKSADMVISDGGRIITCNSGGNSYGLVDCEMESGIWEWEITIVKDNHGDETSCLGIARRPVTNCNYDTTADMWLIRCYNGDAYHCGRLPKKKSIPQIHPNDICKFRFDTDSGSVSLSVNDVEVGVVFENVDRGVSPAISFYGSGKSIKLLSVRQIQATQSYVGLSSSDLSPVPDVPCLQELRESHEDISTTILGQIAKLTSLHLLILDKGDDDTNILSFGSLERPFSIQVCRDSFEQIISLLQNLSSLESDTITATSALLMILKGQFSFLTKSGTDPTLVGFGPLFRGEPNKLLETGHSLLKALMKHPNQQLKYLASDTFSSGIPLFLCDTHEKVKFAVDMLQEIYPIHSNHFEMSQFIVFKTIIKKISDCSEILKILRLFRDSGPSFQLVPILIKSCLHVCSEITLITSSNRFNFEKDFYTDSDLRLYLHKLISNFQEQLLLDIVSSDSANPISQRHTQRSYLLCAEYVKSLCYHVEEILAHFEPYLSSDMELLKPTLHSELRNSIIGYHFLPLIHGICLSMKHIELVRDLLPSFTKTFEKVSDIMIKSPSCQIAHKIISKSFHKVSHKPVVVVEEVNGWRQIKAQFEDSQAEFSITDDSMVYTSSHSSNTCAVVQCGFSGSCRAAWEFVLESDTLDDECAVFGAAHLPLTNRSYSASPNLYMRRAYNGHLYHRGRSIPSSLGKIHPGDIVRIEYDGRAETLSYSVNGGDLETVFSNVVGEVYPCCGSYRNNVRIRLLKVEVFGAASIVDDDDDDHRPPELVKWITESRIYNSKDPSILTISKESPKSNDPSLSWLTGRGDRGAHEGIHCWNYEILESSQNPMAFGIVFDGTPNSDRPLAGSEDPLQPPNHPSLDSKFDRMDLVSQVDRPISSYIGELLDADEDDENLDLFCPDENEIDPIDPDLSREPGEIPSSQTPLLDDLALPPLDFPPRPTLSRTSTPAESPLPIQFTSRRTSLNTSQPSVDYIPPVSPAAEVSQPSSFSTVESVAWRTDGSLWVNGEKKFESFGTKFLPLPKLSVVSIEVDRNIGTISFFVNGIFVGIAFGPKSVSPSVPYDFPYLQASHKVRRDRQICYPAASISSRSHSLRIQAGGFHGSVVLPITLFLQRTLGSVVSRMISCLIEGVASNEAETQFSEWMKSPLLAGGLDEHITSEVRDTDSKVWQDVWEKIKSLEKSFPNIEHHCAESSPGMATSPREIFLDRPFESLDDNEFLDAMAQAWTFDDEMQLKIIFFKFLCWIDQLQPEPPALVKTLEKSGTYSFPTCEFPVIAAMLKHGQLVLEARRICSAFGENSQMLFTPSDSMIVLASKLRQLRWHLRKQRQALLNHPQIVETFEESKEDLHDSKQNEVEFEGRSRIGTIGKNFGWINLSNPVTSRSLGPANSTCRVTSIGFDYRKKKISLNVVISGLDSENSTFHESSSLLLNSLTLSSPKLEKVSSTISNGKIEVVGQLIFILESDLSLSSLLLKDIDLIFRFSSGFTSIVLVSPEVLQDQQLSNKLSEKTTPNLPPSISFDGICSVIADKARFLLTIAASAVRNNETKLNAASKLSCWHSSESQDKWKSVAGVLRVQKRIRKELSELTHESQHHQEDTLLEEILPDLETDPTNEEDVPYSHKSLQECLLFVLSSDTMLSSITSLEEIIQKRYRRGRYRTFGLDALNCVLQMPCVVGDPTSIAELLLYLKSCFNSPPAHKDSCPFEESSQKCFQIAHYFNFLEGCGRGVLETVQISFRSLYSRLAALLNELILLWKNHSNSSHLQDSYSIVNAIFVLLSCWSLHFAEFDHEFLLESSIFQCISSLTSYLSYEKTVADWFVAAESLLELFSSHGKNLPEYNNILRDWKPWSSSYVHNALRFGQLSCRNLLFHLYQVPPGLLTLEDKVNLKIPLEKSFKELCLHYDVSSLSLLHEKILNIFRLRDQRRQRQFEKAQTAYLESKKLEELAEKKRLRDSGVPLFDPLNQSGDIFMEDSDQIAGVKNFQSSSKVASSYVELQYNLSMPQVEQTGNYFEITILVAGMKDIGVGLGVLGTFPTSGEMPGWEPHSYGYHGDDGAKFGAGATPGKWATWEDGDVIGCGLDFSRRTIFYTRNGLLLGDGFRNVPDDHLMPVVSFHSPNTLQKVRLNFGITEFVYKGSEVVVNSTCLKIREQKMSLASSSQTTPVDISKNDSNLVSSVFRLSEVELKSALASYGLSTGGSRSDMEIRLLGAYENQMRLFHSDSLDENDLTESKLSFLEGRSTEWCQSEYVTRTQTLLEETIHLEELTNLRNYGGSLLRFLFTVACNETSSKSEAESQKLPHFLAETSLRDVVLGTQYLQVSFAKNKRPNRHLVVATPPPGNSELNLFGISTQSIGLLEMHEIEYFLGKVIFSCNSLVRFSSALQNVINSSDNLSSLFTLCRIGSPRLQRMSLNILGYCLPMILPKTVDHSIFSFLHESLASSRATPDAVVQVFFSNICEAIAPPSIHSWSIDKGVASTCGEIPLLEYCQIPYGYGRLLLNLADQSIFVVRKLLQVPAWSEITACWMTQSLRSARKVIENGLLNQIFSISSEDFSVLTTASAVCTIFTGFGVIRPGIQVKTPDGSMHWVVSVNENQQKVTLCSSSSYSSSTIVPLSSVDSLSDIFQIDFSVFSQPLLDELVALLGKLLLWYQSTNTCDVMQQLSIETSFFFSSLFRLFSRVSSAIVILYQRQPNLFLELFQAESLIVQSIIQSSLDPIPLHFSPSLEDISQMWTFVQSRVLETNLGSIVCSSINLPDRSELNEITLPQDSDSKPSSESFPPSVVIYSSTLLSERKIVAEQIATELDLPLSICLRRFDYFGGDKKLTIESLVKESKDLTFEPLNLPQSTSFSDDNILRYIDFSSKDGFCTTDTSARNLRVPDVCNLIRVNMPSEDEGVSKMSQLQVGNLVVRGAEDGSLEETPANIFVYVDGVDTPDLITQYCDDELGIPFYCSIPLSESCFVAALYDQKIEHLPTVVSKLDATISKLRLREIAMNLVIDGKFTSMVDINLSEKLLLLLKYQLRQESLLPSPSFMDFLSEVCKSSMTSQCFNPGKYLIEAIKWNLGQLLESSTHINLENTGTEYYECESTHPITLGRENCGVFEIPESWNGSLILIDQRSSTDDSSTSLSFYSSQEDLKNVKPLRKFSGQAGLEKSQFQSFIVPSLNASILSYRFTSGSELYFRPRDGTNSSCQYFHGSSFILDGTWVFELQIERLEENGVSSLGFIRESLQNSGENPHLCFNQFSDLYLNQTKHSSILEPWQSGDVISCLYQSNTSTCRVCFGRNGNWTDFFVLDLCEHDKYIPFYCVAGDSSMKPNIGELSFKFPPPDHFNLSWSPLLGSLQNTSRELERNWGYYFQVHPLRKLSCVVARDFELILKAPLEEGNEIDFVYFWRAKRVSGYKSCGDIITRDNRPPRGCILVASDHCKTIKRYSKVFTSSKHNLTVWKPLPIDGFGCLGDIVTVGTTKPNASACSCIPLFALEKCEILHCLLKSKTKTSKGHLVASIWELNNHLGNFFGSPTERRDFVRKSSEGQICVAIPYKFKSNYLSLIQGEWINENDIISNQPSLKWALNLCYFALREPTIQTIFVTEEMFSLLMKYLSSKNSPENLAVLPILVNILRIALKFNIPLSISTVVQTCNTILNTIFTKYTTEKLIPTDTVFELVDFISEVINDVQIFDQELASISTPLVEEVQITGDDGNIAVKPFLVDIFSSIHWSQIEIPTFYRDQYRLISSSASESILTSKPQLLRQLRDLKLFLLSLESLYDSHNYNELPLYLPPETLLTCWNKFMKLSIFEESSHPYQCRERQSIKKEFHFPGSKMISISLDPRCQLHENSTLKLSNGQSFLILLDSTTIKEYISHPTIMTGSTLIIEFDVNYVDDDSSMSFWGWGLVASAEGFLYETLSTVVDLGKFVTDERSSQVDTQLIKKKLTESELDLVKTSGQQIERKFVILPFAHQIKLNIKKNLTNEGLIDRFYVLEIIPSGDSGSKLLQVNEDPLDEIIGAGSLEYVLYAIESKKILDLIKPSDRLIPSPVQSNQEPPSLSPVNPDRNSWNCALCTFCNDSSNSRCEMCGTTNPNRQTPEDENEHVIEAQENPLTPAVFAVWMCSQCTFMNQIDALRCDICGFSRTADPSARSPSSEAPQRADSHHSEATSDLEEEDEPTQSTSNTSNIPDSSLNTISSLLSTHLQNGVGSTTSNTETKHVEVFSDAPTPVSDKFANNNNNIVISIEGILTPQEKLETCLNQSILNNRWTPFHLRTAMTKWTSDADDVLLELLNADPDSEKVISEHPFQWVISTKYLSQLTLSLADYTLRDIQCRAMLIVAFNSGLKALLPLIDISNSDPQSLGYRLRTLNKYVLLSVKQPILHKWIESTMATGVGLPAHLNLDNFKATLSKDNMQIQPHEANNCFVQAFHQLNKFDSKIFRYIFNSDRVFQIHFEGESGIDAGGVFREGITRIVEDLFDIEHFNLMLLCPNGQHSVHLNMDKFLPNPQHTTSLALQMMEFVGKLMGMSLRAKLALPFNFPSLVWKKILNEEVSTEDLRLVDAITFSLLETLRYCPNDGIINQELFKEKYEDKLKFTYTGCDGVERELFPGGKDVIVTFDTRLEYCDYVLEKRLHECDSQIAAITKGMESVVDMRILHLFSWQQIEILIGGNPAFDIDVWKAHTESSLKEHTLQLFWKVIESLSPKEQEGFVRFAWGRSRLPPAKEFTVKMKLTPRGSEKLPVAHTCFFSIEIPDYKTEEEMRHGILTAIHFGASGVLIG